MDGQGIRSLASFHRAVLNLAFGASIGRSKCTSTKGTFSSSGAVDYPKR